MDVRELRYFLSVARNRSFTKAAEELFIAQSALSRQIKKLEGELGVVLLTRHTRGVELTEAGAALIKRAEPLMHLVKQIKAEVTATSSEPEGHLSIAVPPATGLFIAADFLERFQALYPKVSVHLTEGVSASLQEWLLGRNVDIAILHNAPALPELHIVPLVEEPTLLVGRAGIVHPFARRGLTGLPVSVLQSLPLILPVAPHNNRLLVQRAAAQSGIDLNVVLEIDSVPITKQLVKRGHGYTVFTQTVVREEVLRGEIDTFPLLRPMAPSVLAIAWRKQESPPCGLMEAVTLIRQIVREHMAGGTWPGDVRLPRS